MVAHHGIDLPHRSLVRLANLGATRLDVTRQGEDELVKRRDDLGIRRIEEHH
jgi:hypothetical protein